VLIISRNNLQIQIYFYFKYMRTFFKLYKTSSGKRCLQFHIKKQFPQLLKSTEVPRHCYKLTKSKRFHSVLQRMIRLCYAGIGFEMSKVYITELPSGEQIIPSHCYAMGDTHLLMPLFDLCQPPSSSASSSWLLMQELIYLFHVF
jgi:hypothetical protein